MAAEYRVKVTYTYNSTSNANTAVNNINNVLDNYPNVTGGPATRSGATVTLNAVCPEEDIDSLRFDMIPAWAVGTRSAGKASVVRQGDL